MKEMQHAERGTRSAERQMTERERVLQDWQEIARTLEEWRKKEPDGEAAFREIMTGIVRPALEQLGSNV